MSKHKEEQGNLFKRLLSERASVDDGQKVIHLTVSITKEDLRRLDLISLKIKTQYPDYHITRSSTIRDIIEWAWDCSDLSNEEEVEK